MIFHFKMQKSGRTVTCITKHHIKEKEELLKEALKTDELMCRYVEEDGRGKSVAQTNTAH